MRVTRRHLCLIGLLVSAPVLFASTPINSSGLGGSTPAEARIRLLTAAETLLGVPYLYAGIDRNGLDCSGFVYLSFREGLNQTIPRSSEGIYNWAEKIPDREIQPGDLVFFTTVGSRISHVGIYTGSGWFIHSASEGPHTGVIYSHLNENYWARTYTGAGRALPIDADTAGTLAAARPSPEAPASGGSTGGNNRVNSGRTERSPSADRDDSGFFTGFGASWNWGTSSDGSPSVFRGISAHIMLGYRWSIFQAGLQFRPEWDNALGVARLPFALTFGIEYIQIFGGPAYTVGEPSLSFSDGERYYQGGEQWQWEIGLLAAFPPIKMSRGAVSFYGELSWRPYGSGGDIAANSRVSTGIRYLVPMSF